MEIQTLPCVANNCVTGSGNGLTLQTVPGTSRTVHFGGAAATDLTVSYTNVHVEGVSGAQCVDAVGAGAYPISAAFEMDGNIYPVTFAGLAVGTLSPGATLTSDPIPGLFISPGQRFHVRTYINSTSWEPTRYSYNAAAGSGWIDTVNYTLAGSGTIPDVVHNLFGPSRIGGKGVKGSSLAIFGDSIAFGSGETNGGEGITFPPLASTSGGFLAKAAVGRAGVTSLARGGDTLTFFSKQQGHLLRLPLVSGYTHAVCEYGLNDLNTLSLTLAQIQELYINFWSVLKNKGMKVAQTTITPYTTSTDGWSSVANQTVRPFESTRVALNTWLRAGAPMVRSVASPVDETRSYSVAEQVSSGDDGHPLSHIFDVAAAVESSLNSGKWRTDVGVPTLDGVHPSTIIHNQMATRVPADFFEIEV